MLWASLAARAWARRRSTFCLGVSPDGDDPDEVEEEDGFGEVEGFDCPGFRELGSSYGVFEVTYGPVAVNRVASAAERDIFFFSLPWSAGFRFGSYNARIIG